MEGGTSPVYDSEQDLIRDCIAGIPDAWACLKERYQRLIRAVVVRTSAMDESGVDDLEATVYQKLLEDQCRRLRAWRGQARFSTYLVQVTRNLVLDWVDKQKRTLDTDPIDERTESAAPATNHELDEEVALQHAALRAAIQALPEKQALIMRLRIEGKSLRDIAQLLHRPVGTVSVESSRAMERMRRMLEQSGAFETGVRT
jgi:RNA polymerase sigma-70 factor (ECF subfamily)